MKCYLVKVETTSPLRTTFQRGDQYFPCVDGKVFVMAANIAEAAKQLPMALAIEELGVAFSGSADGVKPAPLPIGG